MSKKKAQQQAQAPEQVPISSAPLPLTQLEAKALGEFIELAFGDKKLLDLCAELKLYSPGYRLENLPPQDVARMLADEALAAKDAALLLDKAVRETLRDPFSEGAPLSEKQVGDVIDLFFGDRLQHLARIAWRALLEPDEKLKAQALEAIKAGIDLLSAPPPQKPTGDDLPDNLKAARAEVKELRRSTGEAINKMSRAEKERAAAKEQLTQARADIAAREASLAQARDELEHARADLAKASAELARLTAAGEGRALSDARRLADENRSLSEKLRAAGEERDSLREKLTALEKRAAAPAAQQPAQPAAEEEPLVSAEEAATFLIPFFSREFYDSIQKWDRRMQRAAFDKVSLLARDWRHGSLRALALEGLPGYYRIRIATDVRLIYRRGEGNTLEILSLIDREDLDRYIRQARTR